MGEKRMLWEFYSLAWIFENAASIGVMPNSVCLIDTRHTYDIYRIAYSNWMVDWLGDSMDYNRYA